MDGDAGGDFVMIGAGAVASALAPALVEAGVRCRGVIGRERMRAESLADALGCPVVDEAPPARLVCVCVPDDAITGVARGLAALTQDWSDRAVLHVSGGHGAAALDAVAERGAVTLAFHPVQTFVYPSSPRALAGITVGISGEPAAVDEGRSLAALLGMRPVVIEEADRPLYHLATSIVSNGTVTLSALAHEVLSACGLTPESSQAMLAPLVAASAHNLAGDLPEAVLTGPVVRGDVKMVEAHLAATGQRAPHLLPVVAALVSETVRLAVRSGRLDPAGADRLLEIVSGMIRPE